MFLQEVVERIGSEYCLSTVKPSVQLQGFNRNMDSLCSDNAQRKTPEGLKEPLFSEQNSKQSLDVLMDQTVCDKTFD